LKIDHIIATALAAAFGANPAVRLGARRFSNKDEYPTPKFDIMQYLSTRVLQCLLYCFFLSPLPLQKQDILQAALVAFSTFYFLVRFRRRGLLVDAATDWEVIEAHSNSNSN
jgi:hypothetical protein